MRNMVMADVVEKESAHPAQEWSVNSGSGTPQERPFSLPVVRDRWVGVVKEGKHNNPVINKLIARSGSRFKLLGDI